MRLTGKDPTVCSECGRGHLRRVEELALCVGRVQRRGRRRETSVPLAGGIVPRLRSRRGVLPGANLR